MKRIPKIGSKVWVTSRKFTGAGVVIDVFSKGEAAEITVRDSLHRCWVGTKERMTMLDKKGVKICDECSHTYDDCNCAEDDGTPIRQRGGAREGAGQILLNRTFDQLKNRYNGKKEQEKTIGT